MCVSLKPVRTNDLSEWEIFAAACLRWWGAFLKWSEFAHGKQKQNKIESTQQDDLSSVSVSFPVCICDAEKQQCCGCLRSIFWMLFACQQEIQKRKKKEIQKFIELFYGLCPHPEMPSRAVSGLTAHAPNMPPSAKMTTSATAACDCDCHKALDSHFHCRLYISYVSL